jgi:hypothetical protein
MMQTMVLVGILAICAVSGALLTYRPRWLPGPDEPAGSRLAPTPPVPTAPQATAGPGPSPAAVTPSSSPAAVAVPVKPTQPLPTDAAATALPAPPRPVAAPARRSRNNGFHRFAPASAPAVGRITPGTHR